MKTEIESRNLRGHSKLELWEAFNCKIDCREHYQFRLKPCMERIKIRELHGMMEDIKHYTNKSWSIRRHEWRVNWSSEEHQTLREVDVIKQHDKKRGDMLKQHKIWELYIYIYNYVGLQKYGGIQLCKMELWRSWNHIITKRWRTLITELWNFGGHQMKIV